MTSDNRNSIEPEKTPLFIGAGVTFHGSFKHEGPADEKAVILGELTGNIQWNGILQVPRGGKVIVESALRCREMVVGGEIVGANDEVVIETGLLRLGESASIDVATVSVPPGGLEQSRGSVINAKLRMTKEHPFADTAADPAAAKPQRLLPVLTAVATPDPRAGVGGQAGEVPQEQGAADSSLVQIETRTPLAA